MNTWWNSIAPRRRLALLLSAGLVLATLFAASWMLLRTEQAVLFTDLRPQDAAAMTAELERLKVPYAIADNGASLTVDRSQVHAIRLKLMASELPLHGTVGFELFNNSDFGMTEFAQKINYQRALQGELTRTILSFPEIRDARVHLALPEQGLFRQATSRPKAAVSVSLREGQSLRANQVQGIQRLLAAAVPGLLAQEVTLVDQSGVALSGWSESDANGAPAGGARLELKRDTEAYLSRKAGLVLEKLFGPGQVLASVDVTLDMDQVRVTTEDVLAAPDAKTGATAGVLVRERESAHDNAMPDARGPDARIGRGSSMQRDTEYQAGRRVEQVASHPGAIRRLQVIAVVRQPLTDAQRQQVLSLVGAAVGAAPERGDTVVVQAFGSAGEQAQAPIATPAAAMHPQAAGADASHALAVFAVVLVCIGIVGAAAWPRWRRAPPVLRLTEAERNAALHRVRSWVAEADAQPVHDSAGASARDAQ